MSPLVGTICKPWALSAAHLGTLTVDRCSFYFFPRNCSRTAVQLLTTVYPVSFPAVFSTTLTIHDGNIKHTVQFALLMGNPVRSDERIHPRSTDMEAMS